MRVTVTGSTGFLGTHVCNELLARGHTVRGLNSSLDLRKADAALEALRGADCVVHLAAKVGGIGSNKLRPGEFFFDNALMSLNVIHSAHLLKTPRLVLAGTVCSYPKIVPSPFKEEMIWSGYPEETNAAYGLSKKILDEMAKAYNKQYGLNYISLLPTNMYGENDHYGEETSHVIPATFKRIDYALKTGKTPVFWGTGGATREFLYVKDAAKAFVLAAESEFIGGPINIGSGHCFSIKDTVTKVSKIMDYKGPIQWDHSKPDGQPHRFLDCTKAKQILSFEAETSFEDGLKATLNDYRERFSDM